MRKILLTSVCSLALSGCFMAPGQNLDTSDAQQSSAKSMPMATPTIIPINSYNVHHASQNHSCTASEGHWLCSNRNHYEYLVGAEDILNIVVWDHPELTTPEGQYRSAQETGILVNADGTIFFPFAGTLQASGKTVEVLRKEITKKLAKYIQQPQISVRVAEFNSQKIQVMGEVAQPKVEPVTNVPLNLMTAINAAGGISQNTADAKYVYVIRGPISHPKLFWLNANKPDALLLSEQFFVQSGDVVYVTTAPVARWGRVIAAIYPTFEAGQLIRNETK